MSKIEWRPVAISGFSKYIMSNTGILKRIAYVEPKSGRYMKEVVVSCRNKVEGVVQVRMLSDDKKEYNKMLHAVLHATFPEIPYDICKQIADNQHAVARSRIPSIKDLEGEIWKDCVRYEEMYLVSNCGRIKRKHRKIIRSNGRPYTVTEHILKQSVIGRDYRCVNIILENDKNKFEFVHRLVAETWIPNPDNLPEVNHKDGCGSNNHVDNLEWSTHKDNAIHAWNTGLYSQSHPVICLETKEVFDSIYALARILNIPWPTILNKIASNSPIRGLYYNYTEKLDHQ